LVGVELRVGVPEREAVREPDRVFDGVCDGVAVSVVEGVLVGDVPAEEVRVCVAVLEGVGDLLGVADFVGV
jgi:hypothetical protein